MIFGKIQTESNESTKSDRFNKTLTKQWIK
jgi:hypothetical protein